MPKRGIYPAGESGGIGRDGPRGPGAVPARLQKNCEF